ncbi:MAG: hypothetical protein MUE80_05060 [Acidobacteria bacterium]|nr:hypothetical protein [Acidobacteriota bacterium]
MRKTAATAAALIAVLALAALSGCGKGTPPDPSRPAAASAQPATASPQAEHAPWPPPKDLNELYGLEFKAYRVGEMPEYAVTALGDRRVRLLFGIVDGGCIEKETLTVRSVETGADNVRTMDLLYALDGQPCKALFKRALEATFRLPEPGTYRIRLWVDELYHGRGPQPAPVREIVIGQ